MRQSLSTEHSNAERWHEEHPSAERWHEDSRLAAHPSVEFWHEDKEQRAEAKERAAFDCSIPEN